MQQLLVLLLFPTKDEESSFSESDGSADVSECGIWNETSMESNHSGHWRQMWLFPAGGISDRF